MSGRCDNCGYTGDVFCEACASQMTTAPVSDKGDTVDLVTCESCSGSGEVGERPCERPCSECSGEGCKPHPPAGAALSEVAQNIVHEWEWGRRPSATAILAAFAERVKREAHQFCNGSCDIALARRQVGPDGVVPGNARECAELWEREAARLRSLTRSGSGSKP